MKLISPLNIGNIDNVRRVSNAYYRDAVGKLVMAGPNVARFNYDIAGNFLGILTEPLPYQSVISKSDEFSDTSIWQRTGVTLGTRTTGPDGITNSAQQVSGTGTLRVVDQTVYETSFRLQQPAEVRVIKAEMIGVGTARPYVVGIGAQRAKSSGALTTLEVFWPAHQAGDIGILLVKAGGTNVDLVNAGWTEFAADGISQAYRVFWRRATNAAQGPALVLHRGQSIARIITVRGAVATGSPFGAIIRDSNNTVTDRRVVEGFVATRPQSLILILASYFLATATLITSEWNNSSLTNLTVNLDGTGFATFAQGGFIVASGDFTVGGTISSTSAVRSSIFVRHREGDGRVRVRNHLNGTFQEFDMVNPVEAPGKTVEMYQDGWYRLTVPSTGPYGFELQFFGGEFDIFRANLVATGDYYQPLLNLNPMTGDILLPYTTSQLVYSNIPEPDPDYEPEVGATLWVAGTYPRDAKVIYDHGLYIALRETSDRPDIGAAKPSTNPDDPQSWSRLGTSNHWRMYDMLRGIEYQSTKNSNIDQIVFVPKIARGYALLGIEGSQLRVQASLDGEVLYDTTYQLTDLSANAYWYEFFTVKPMQKTSVVAFDLPPVPGLLVRFTLTGEGPVALGKLIVGEQLELGCTKWNVKTEYVNTSRQEREEFGNLVLVPRRIYKVRDFELTFDTRLAERGERVIETVIGGPAVFVGSLNYTTTIIYGIVKDFRIVLSNPTTSIASLKVESI